MRPTAFALRGDILFTPEPNQLTALPDGVLVCEGGRVAGVFKQLPEAYAGIPVADYRGRLILPGLVDLHVHAPQYAFRGLGMDLELLPWLQTYTFPEEAKYRSLDYAEQAYSRFVQDLGGSATTRACVFATLHVPATKLLMGLLDQTGIQAFVGKVNMDRNSIETLCETTEQSAADTLAWLEDCGDAFQNVRPILTPRFIPSCSDDLMRRVADIQRKHRLPVQSHLSENRSESAWVQELCPDSTCYGDAYARYGLFGGTVPTVMAHCVHSTEAEIDLMDRQGVFVAHCPQSNMNLSSGIAPVRAYMDRNMHVGLGSDLAGGADLSIFCAMRDAIRASKLRWALIDSDSAPLTVPEALYLATKGGGAFWGQVGSFEPGFEFDAVVLDDSRFQTLRDYASLPQRLERLIYLADDRCVQSKYIRGVKVR